MRIKVVLVCFFCLLNAKLSAESTDFKTGFSEKYALSDLSLDVWTNKMGMVSNNVISVFQSEDEFIWIASYNGLQRFDGLKFEVFDQTNIPFLASNTFYECTQAQDGTLWFSTGASGIVGYNDNGFFQHPFNDSIPKAIISIFVDSQDNLWIGSKNNGLYKLSAAGVLTKESRIEDQSIHSITEDVLGHIWIASDHDGIFKMSANTVQNYSKSSQLNENLINTSFHAPDSVSYVGTTNGINVIKGKKIESIAVFEGYIVDDIIVDDYGFLWAATNQGMARYHLLNGTFEILTENDGLPRRGLVDLFFDNEGSLWVSTYESGLVRFKTTMISNVTIRDGLSSNKVNVVNSVGGKHYMGTQDGVVNVFDGQRFDQIELKDEFRKDVIRDIMFENEVIWVANYRGLVKVEKNRKTYFTEKNGLPNNKIRRIFKDSKGQIWLGTRNGGLIAFNENGDHKVINKDKGLGTNYVMAIDEDQNGRLVIGTNAGGLIILTEEGIERHSIKEDDSGTLIFGLTIDDSNAIWLCTNFGLYKFSEGVIRKVTLFPALQMEKFFDIVDDQNGSFWLSSSKGVLEVQKTDLTAYFNGSITMVPYEKFGEEDGMESEECTGATRSFFDEQTGKIWVPTFEGVAIIDPKQRTKNMKVPKVLITNIQVDNTLMSPLSQGIQIKPGTFRYLFDVTALSYLAPSKVLFKYKLEGIDEDWSEPYRDRRIEYTNLPFGDYTLRVVAANNDNVWNEEGTSLSFTVLPYLFETMKFRIGVALILMLLFRLFYVWRVRDIKRTNKVLTKMNAELDKFVYSASHDLRGPLTSTIGLINLALIEPSISKKDEYFGLIQQCTDKMDHFINELITYSKNKNDKVVHTPLSVISLLNDVFDKLSLANPEYAIQLEVDIDGEGQMVGDANRLRILFSYLLHNAMVFADAAKSVQKVSVSMKSLEGKVVISVLDNGVGISTKVLNKVFDMFFRAHTQSVGSGLGLYIVRETVNKLGGTVAVTSEEGVGSEFQLTIPV